MRLILLIAALSIWSFERTEKGAAIAHPQSSEVGDTAKLRFDGIYNTYDTSLAPCGQRANEMYVTDHLLVFFKNGSSYLSPWVTRDDIAFKPEFYKKSESKRIGKYTIKGDSLYSVIPTNFVKGGMVVIIRDAYYRGYIKNRDTILDWKMVPPYPKVNKRLNDYFKRDTVGTLHYFMKNDAIRALDSVAGNY